MLNEIHRSHTYDVMWSQFFGYIYPIEIRFLLCTQTPTAIPAHTHTHLQLVPHGKQEDMEVKFMFIEFGIPKGRKDIFLFISSPIRTSSPLLVVIMCRFHLEIFSHSLDIYDNLSAFVYTILYPFSSESYKLFLGKRLRNFR